MPNTINVVEPTLKTAAGHCYSFITALCELGDDTRVLRLWASRRAKVTFDDANVELKKHFFHKIRRFQSYFLYKSLLKAPGKVFVSTARHADLVLLNWAARGVVPPKKVYLYVHWFNATESKLASLRQLARKQPNLEIYGPTPSVTRVFRDAGFRHAQVVPYPISRLEPQGGAAPRFRHLLYAGAARCDKGFSHVVDLVEHMQRRRLQIPVVLQTSAEQEGKYDAGIRADLKRLDAIGYPHLSTRGQTLEPRQYADMFTGAICLQLYDAGVFSDRVSGVTLDAFSSGSPVVSTPGSWIARTVQRFDAGTVVGDARPESVLAAVEQQIVAYAGLAARARAAGKVLQEENSARTLFQLLTD